MTYDLTNPPIEVEAKFLGGQPEFEKILDWLESKKGFECARKPDVHRIHVYFDDGFKLRDAGCRLRCVIAAGEWCRYDFKAENGSTREETLEVCIRKSAPVSIRSLIHEMLKKLPLGHHRSLLASVRDAAQIVLVMAGTHQKTLAVKEDLHLEISWDQLALVDTGGVISEIEIELKRGTRDAFDKCIQVLEQELVVKRIRASKYQQGLDLRRREVRNEA